MAAIERLAVKLTGMLMRRDPMSEPVHLSKPAFALTLICAVCTGIGRRLFLPRTSAATVVQGSDDRPSH